MLDDVWLSEPKKCYRLNVPKRQYHSIKRRQKQLHAKKMQGNTKKECQRPPLLVKSDLEMDSDCGSQPDIGLPYLDGNFEVGGVRLWTKIYEKIILFSSKYMRLIHSFLCQSGPQRKLFLQIKITRENNLVMAQVQII